ncbi:MAG: AraC family transcriptional regulator [Coprobacillus sp.]
MENKLSITDNNLMDTVDHGSHEFPIQYYVDELYSYPKQMVPLHWHLELEFYVSIGGTTQIQIGNDLIYLEEGNGIFINSNILHSFQQANKEDKCQCPNIVYSHDLIAPTNSIIYKKYIQQMIMNHDIPYFLLYQDCSWHKDILSLLDKVFSLLQKYGQTPDFYGNFPILPYQNSSIESCCFEMETQYNLNKIWQIIYTHISDIPKIQSKQSKHMLQIRTQKMLQFIHNNYSFPISLKDIADAANISKSEASRCFQSYLNTSPVNYLLTYRLNQAKYALQHSNNTIIEIADQCGFQSSSYFGKIFHRETGMSASQYRTTSRHI